MIVFGGQRKLKVLSKYRICLNDVLAYDFYAKEWKEFYSGRSKMLSEPIKRRDHAGCLLGNRLVIYGGLDKKGDYLDDVWEFYFKRKTWYKCNT